MAKRLDEQAADALSDSVWVDALRHESEVTGHMPRFVKLYLCLSKENEEHKDGTSDLDRITQRNIGGPKIRS